MVKGGGFSKTNVIKNSISSSIKSEKQKQSPSDKKKVDKRRQLPTETSQNSKANDSHQSRRMSMRESFVKAKSKTIIGDDAFTNVCNVSTSWSANNDNNDDSNERFDKKQNKNEENQKRQKFLPKNENLSNKNLNACQSKSRRSLLKNAHYKMRLGQSLDNDIESNSGNISKKLQGAKSLKNLSDYNLVDKNENKIVKENFVVHAIVHHQNDNHQSEQQDFECM